LSFGSAEIFVTLKDNFVESPPRRNLRRVAVERLTPLPPMATIDKIINRLVTETDAVTIQMATASV